MIADKGSVEVRSLMPTKVLSVELTADELGATRTGVKFASAW